MNPFSAEMQKAYRTFLALKGLDANFSAYIAYADGVAETAAPRGEEPLERAIVKGLAARAGEAARELLKTEDPLSLVNEKIIPALNEVGKGFEEKRVYLPQLLMSADAAKEAFAAVQAALPASAAKKGEIVLATVKGDIHDIGKNIVKALLENFGFAVVDLGRDVPPETIVAETVSRRCRLVGLSALMTTTVPYMAETIALLKREAPYAKTVVGGAVLTQEYADAIGADKYASDAMETVRYAQSLFEEK